MGAVAYKYCAISDLYLGKKASSWGCVKLELEMFL